MDGKLSIGENCLQCGVCVGKCPFKARPARERNALRIYVGGTWGKQTRMGSPLSRLVGREEIEPLLEQRRCSGSRKNAYEKERLGKAIDRIGFDASRPRCSPTTCSRARRRSSAQPIKTR